MSIVSVSSLRTVPEAVDNVVSRSKAQISDDFSDIVGESAALRLALSRLSRVAPTNSSVLLLLGKTGTGKELFARAARPEPAPWPAILARELHGAPADADRKRTVRPREGCLHRGGGDYYRLSVYPIYLPSLSERLEDIPKLVWFFIREHQREVGRVITNVPEAVMQKLQHHSWPGNVRELANVVERALIASSGDTLQLDEPLFGSAPSPLVAPSDNLDDVQRMHIESVLQRSGWRINGPGNAAESLGMHPNTLRFRMRSSASPGRGIARGIIRGAGCSAQCKCSPCHIQFRTPARAENSAAS